MLVENGKVDLLGQLPTGVEVSVARVRARPCCTHDDNLGMGLAHAFINIFEALDELWRDALLIAQTQVFQVEWLRMSGLGTHTAPFGGHVAIGPFYQVECLGYPFVHLVHRHAVLGLVFHSPATIGALATHSAGEDGEGLHAQVFAELEILKVAQAHRLVISPGVLQAAALLLRSHSGLPTVGVPCSVATTMHHTSTGEAHELGMEGGKGLGQVFAQAMAFVGVVGHQRYHVDVHRACGEREYLEGTILHVAPSGELGLVFLPVTGIHVDSGVGYELGVFAPTLWLDKGYPHLLGSALDIAQECREVILCTRLQRDAVESVVLNAIASPAGIVVIVPHALNIYTHVGGVVGMDGTVGAGLQMAKRVAGANHAPRCAGSPTVTLGGVVLE